MRSSTSSTPAPFNFQAFLDAALVNYTKRTGKGLATHPFTALLERCRSPDDVLALFTKQAEAFDEFRNGNPKLTKWLEPIVHILHQFCTNDTLTARACCVSSIYHGRRLSFPHFFSNAILFDSCFRRLRLLWLASVSFSLCVYPLLPASGSL